MVATICRSNTSPPVTGRRCKQFHPPHNCTGRGRQHVQAGERQYGRNHAQCLCWRRGHSNPARVGDKRIKLAKYLRCDVECYRRIAAASSKAREAACCGASALTAYAKMFASSIPGSTSIVVDVSAVESTHGPEMQDWQVGG